MSVHMASNTIKCQRIHKCAKQWWTGKVVFSVLIYLFQHLIGFSQRIHFMKLKKHFFLLKLESNFNKGRQSLTKVFQSHFETHFHLITKQGKGKAGLRFEIFKQIAFILFRSVIQKSSIILRLRCTAITFQISWKWI